jgi:hypothetical protein
MPLFETIGQLATAVGPSIVNAFSQNRTNQQNYQNQLELQSRAHAHQRSMFDTTNAYNTPLNQIECLKEAGINPAVFYSNQYADASGNASMPGSIGAPSAPAGQAPKISGLMKYYQIRQNGATK